MRDGDVDANGDSIGLGGGNEIDHNVQWTTLWVVRNAVFGLSLDVILGACKTGKGGKKQKDGEKGVPDMVVDGGFGFL
jgi:hypothetical protein